MFRQILLALLGFIVIAFIILWVIGGGPRRTVDRITGIDVIPFDTSDDVGFRLPWQPAQLFPVIDITGAFQVAEDDYGAQEYELAQLEEEYERLSRDAATSRTFGSPSPYTGSVSIVPDTAGIRASEASDEYVQIASDFKATASVDIAGWSIESALSGARIYLPAGASSFNMGATNTLGPITLSPGAIAIISSAASPVGVSFRENICTGYLAQFQSFSPQLNNECPSPSSALPLTEENLIRYGDACFDVVASLTSCEFPQNLPGSVAPSCRAYLMDALSYNGCVSRERTRSSFEKNIWRIFLGSGGNLWRDSHDALRLLDAQGKTVDVFVY